MGAIGDFTNTLLNSANTANSIMDDRIRKQAQFDLNTRKLRLQEEINSKMNDFSTRSDYENWEQEIDNLFTETQANMSNQDSDFYCRNNLTAQMFNEVLNNARVQTQQRTTELVLQFNEKKKDLDYNQSYELLKQMYSGQDFVDNADILIDSYSQTRQLDPIQIENLKAQAFKDAMAGVYGDFYNQIVNKALVAGKTADEVWNDIDRGTAGSVKRKDENGITIPNYGSGEFKKEQAEIFKQKYKADQAQYQRQNAEWYSNDIVDIRGDIVNLISGAKGAKNATDIVARINIGHGRLEKTQQSQLGNGVKDSLSKEYKQLLDLLENYEKAVNKGAGSGSVNAPSFNSVFLRPGFTENYLQGIESGQYDNPYQAAREMKECLEDGFFNNGWKEKSVYQNGTKRDMTEQEQIKYFTEQYENTAAHELLNSDYLQKRLKSNYPSLYQKYNNLVKDIEKDILKPEKQRKYTAGAATYIANFINDLMAGAGNNSDLKAMEALLDTQINAVTIDGLNGLFKSKKHFENYDDYIGRTAKELRENDVLMTDDYRNTRKWAPGTEEKVNRVAKEQRDYIASKLNIELNNDWTYMVTENDAQPIPIFTDKAGNKYIIEPGENGTAKIVDERGTVYNSLSKKERRQQNTAERKANAEERKQARAEEEAIVDSEDEAMRTTLAASKTIPELVKEYGNTNTDNWNSEAGGMLNRNEAYNKTIRKLDQLANDNNYSDAEFKAKTGVTKAQWKAITKRSEKYNIVSKS